jgi:hypothetical protein
LQYTYSGPLSSAVVYQTTLGIYLKKSLSFPVTAEQ